MGAKQFISISKLHVPSGTSGKRIKALCIRDRADFAIALRHYDRGARHGQSVEGHSTLILRRRSKKCKLRRGK